MDDLIRRRREEALRAARDLTRRLRALEKADGGWDYRVVTLLRQQAEHAESFLADWVAEEP